MQKIQKMEAGKYYMIESTASANSVYFEGDTLAKLFFRYCDYYLKDYLNVEEYVLNQDGWAMLIKIKSRKTIQKYYRQVESKRKPKIKLLKSDKPKAIWSILSERVRLFISTYVRISNKLLGREGSLVRRRYTRYKFDSLESAKSYIIKLRKGEHELQQTEDKYRGSVEHFGMSGNVQTNPLRSSLWLRICDTREKIQENLVRMFGSELPVLKELGALVALKSELYKSPENSPPFKPKKH